MILAPDLDGEPSLDRIWRALSTACPRIKSESEIGVMGNLAQWFDYAPYGSLLASGNTGTTTVARQYIGQYSDSSGLDYLNARYLNPAQGQFISEDPVFLGNPSQENLQDPQSLNSYSYSEDNPTVKSDPKGLYSLWQVANGQATWGQYWGDVDQGAVVMGQNPGWNFAFTHPYATAAATGLLAVPAAEAGTGAVAAFGAASYPGVGAAYAAQQAFAGTVYTALTFGALQEIPNTVNNLSQVSLNNPSSYAPAVVNLGVQVGPTFAGGYINTLSDIYQLVSLIGEEVNNLITSQGNQSSGPSVSHSSSGSTSGGGSSGGGSSGSTAPANLHTACGALCL
jgi:RHS repeat-associated protein